MPNTIILLICSICFVTAIVCMYMHPQKEQFSQQNLPCIYCITITGKDSQRACFADEAIANFVEQDYPNKRLIIINHGNVPVLKDNPHNIFEFQVPKENNTLGDLRNIALQLVPIDALWTVWDDDDYRIPSYMSLLYGQMQKNKSDVVVFTKRIECNLETDFVWEMQLKTGFVFVLAKQDLRIKYLSKDSMEDVNLLTDFLKLDKQISVWVDNPSTMYIRLTHQNNTSLYVDKNKKTTREPTSSIYIENNVDVLTQNKVLDFMKTKFLQCLI